MSDHEFSRTPMPGLNTPMGLAARSIALAHVIAERERGRDYIDLRGQARAALRCIGFDDDAMPFLASYGEIADWLAVAYLISGCGEGNQLRSLAGQDFEADSSANGNQQRRAA